VNLALLHVEARPESGVRDDVGGFQYSLAAQPATTTFVTAFLLTVLLALLVCLDLAGRQQAVSPRDDQGELA